MLADALADAKLRADAQALERDLRSENRALAKSSSEPLAASSSSKTSRSPVSMEDHQLRNIVDSIPTFSGDPNQNVRDWIEIISLKFDIIDYDPLQRRRFLPQYLYGAALKWHLANRATLTELRPYLRALELAFPQVTTTSRDMNLQLLKNRVQGPTEPFHLYYNAVVDLCRQHNREMADVQIVDWLKAGMRLELFEKLHGDEFLTPQSLLIRTQRLELDHEVLTTRQRLSLVPTASATPLMDAVPVVTYPPVQHSYSPHHHAFAPSQTSSAAHRQGSAALTRRRQPIVCYSCGEPGHISPRCPHRPKA